MQALVRVRADQSRHTIAGVIVEAPHGTRLGVFPDAEEAVQPLASRAVTRRGDVATVTTAAGVAVGLTGLGLVGMGLWGRREVRLGLERERIMSVPDADHPSTPVASAAGARSMAEVIRRITIDSTGGRTYAEIEPYIDPEGKATSDEAQALKDERTGKPAANPDLELWIQSVTLQTALMQAYMAFRLSELTAGLGGGLVAAGAGLVAAGRRH